VKSKLQNFIKYRNLSGNKKCEISLINEAPNPGIRMGVFLISGIGIINLFRRPVLLNLAHRESHPFFVIVTSILPGE
jgi:hypothetical protein